MAVPSRAAPFRAERLTSASSWRLAFLALQGVGSLVLFSSLGHALPRHAFAATAVAQGVIVLAQSIGDFGLSQAAVTVLPGRIATHPGDEAELLAGAATAYGGAAALAAILTVIAVPLVPAAARGPVAVSSLASAACVVVAGADGLLRSRGEFRRPLLLMASSEGAGFAGLPVAIFTGSAIWTCTAVSLGMALGAVGSVALLVRLHRATPRRTLRSFLVASAPLGFSQLSIALATRANTLIAGLTAGVVAAGTFEGCWRIYQLSQYAAGGIASAAAPFIADSLARSHQTEALRFLRQLMIRLLLLGLGSGIALYLLRAPIGDVLAGSLGHNVSEQLPILALASPVTAVGLAAYYTLIGRDGERGVVLAVVAAGAVVNLVLAASLGASIGIRGVVIACTAGQLTTSLLLLARFAPFVRRIRSGAAVTATQRSAELTPRP